jgi:hypothetical protein
MKQQSLLGYLETVTIGILFLSVGCAHRNSASAPGLTTNSVRELGTLQERRLAYDKRLKAMSVAQLVEELRSDSEKAREPFNSAAYREIVSRGEGATAELKSKLTRNDRASLLGLLALRQMSQRAYQSLTPSFRISVFADSLKSSKYFNTWGIPNAYWEEAAKALINEGESAKPSLVVLLRDTRAAPVFGSEGAEINHQNHYRVCDYALALLDEILRRKVDMPADPAERDRLIEQELTNQK